MEPEKNPREKISDQGKTTRKNFGPTKNSPEKFLETRMYDIRLHETQETKDGTRPTEYSTLFITLDTSRSTTLGS